MSIAAFLSLIFFLLAFVIDILVRASVLDGEIEVVSLNALGALIGIFPLAGVRRQKERRRRIVCMAAGGISLAFWLFLFWVILADLWGELIALSIFVLPVVCWGLFRATRKFSRAARFDILLVYLFFHLGCWTAMHHAVATGARADGGPGFSEGALRFALPWTSSGQNQAAPPCSDMLQSVAPIPPLLATYRVAYFPSRTDDGRILCQPYAGWASGYIFTGVFIRKFFDRTLWQG